MSPRKIAGLTVAVLLLAAVSSCGSNAQASGGARGTIPWGPFEVVDYSGDSLVAGGIGGPAGTSVPWRTPLEADVNATFNVTQACKVVDAGRPLSYHVHGYSGTQMDQWASTAVADVTGHGCTIAFVAWGRNDAVAGTAPATTKANLKSGVLAVWAVEPNIKVVVVGVQEDGELWPDGAGPNDAAIDAMNVAIHAGADELSASGPISYIDIRTFWFSVIPALNPANTNGNYTMTVDNLHLNAVGARKTADYLWTLRVPN